MSGVLLLSGTVPALAAALDLASVGIRVRIAAGVAPEVPKSAVRDVEGVLSEFLLELSAPLADGGTEEVGMRPTASAPEPISLRAKDGTWKPQPELSVWGIPAVPLATDCMNLVGAGTAMRAYLDRLKPVLTIGKQDNLAKLVDSRLGTRARQLLVEPIIFERTGRAASEVDVGFIAPGLNEALTRAGSLSGAALIYHERYVARETIVAPADGWIEFGQALLDRLMLFGADRLEHPLVSLESTGAGDEWTATSEAGDGYVFDAVVLSSGVNIPGSEALDAEIVALQSKQARVYAEIGIEDPETTASRQDFRDTVELCEDSQGSTWSVRVQNRAQGGWVAVLRSNAFEREQLAHDDDVIKEIIEQLGYVPTAAPVTSLRAAAPYTTRAEAEAADGVLSAWHESNPRVLLSGPEYFGDELAPALASAREHAVSLRRRLTGIA